MLEHGLEVLELILHGFEGIALNGTLGMRGCCLMNGTFMWPQGLRRGQCTLTLLDRWGSTVCSTAPLRARNAPGQKA